MKRNYASPASIIIWNTSGNFRSAWGKKWNSERWVWLCTAIFRESICVSNYKFRSGDMKHALCSFSLLIWLIVFNMIETRFISDMSLCCWWNVFHYRLIMRWLTGENNWREGQNNTFVLRWDIKCCGAAWLHGFSAVCHRFDVIISPGGIPILSCFLS